MKTNIILFGDLMKKILILLFIVVLSMLCGCLDGPIYTVSYPEPVVVLPDEETYYSINGYKDTSSTPSANENGVESNTEQSKPIYDGRYLGNINTKKLHRSDCSYIKKTKEENIEIFEDTSSAVLKGYSVCKRCITE